LRDIEGAAVVAAAVGGVVVAVVVVVAAAGAADVVVVVECGGKGGAFPWLQQDSEAQTRRPCHVVHDSFGTPIACVRSGVIAVWSR
jgi:hypothetical protein